VIGQQKEEKRGMGYRNFTPEQLLNRAIGKEEEARMMYEIYADKVEDRQSKELLKELAQQELGHKRALEKFDPTKPGAFNAPEISSGEFGEFFDRPEISKEAGMQEVLRYAIAKEADAFNFYTSMKKYTSDEDFLNLLNTLSAEEKKHKQKLERMYDDMFQPEN
jgi:rubrerythrin